MLHDFFENVSPIVIDILVKKQENSTLFEKLEDFGTLIRILISIPIRIFIGIPRLWIVFLMLLTKYITPLLISSWIKTQKVMQPRMED